MAILRRSSKTRHTSALSLRELLRIQDKIERETGIHSLHDVRVTRDMYIYHGVLPASSHHDVDRDVFVKIFLSGDESSKALFDRESWIYSHFHHDHLVRKEFSRTLNLGRRARHARMIVLEYIDGIDAAKLIDTLSLTGRKLDVAVVLEIAIKILKALHEVHFLEDRHGQKFSVIHADITPHNILLSRKGQVKLIDFGVARVCPDPFDIIQDKAGKPGYMAPEQVHTDHFDHRADLYSLGVVIIELLLARRLCSIQDMERLRASELHSSYKEQLAASNIDSELREILLKAIDENPDGRFSSAREFMQSLENHLQTKNMILRADVLAAVVDGVMKYSTSQETRQNTDFVQVESKQENVDVKLALTKLTLYVRFIVGKSLSVLPYFLGIFLAVLLLVVLRANLTRTAIQISRDDKPAVADSPDEMKHESDSRAKASVGIALANEAVFKSATSDTGTLFVGASPWAEASIAGFASQRPIPFSIKLPTGAHVVTARYQDDAGRWRYLSKSVDIGVGVTVKCLAYFDGGRGMVCR